MATLKTIAEQAGVSEATVSQILNGKYKETRPTMKARAKRIREIARQVNYRPNGAAKAVSKGCFDCVAIIQDCQLGASSLPQKLLDGIHDELAGLGKHVTYTRFADELLDDKQQLPRVLRELLVDGMLVNINTNAPTMMDEMIRAYALPAVWINAERRSNCVRPDDFGAGVRLTKHLLEQGRKDIVYVDYAFNVEVRHYSREARYQGYAKAMRDAELEPRLLTTPKHELRLNQVEHQRQWLADTGVEVDAVISYDVTHLQAMWFRGGFGGVLSDVLYGAFDDKPAHGLPVAVMVMPHERIGRQAVRLLQKQMSNPKRNQRVKEIPLQLWQGSKCLAKE